MKRIWIFTMLVGFVLIQISCNAKPVKQTLCWAGGGTWICDDPECQSGQCQKAESAKEVDEPAAPFLDAENQCFNEGRLWICDDPDCLTGHCEDLQHAVVEAPVEENPEPEAPVAEEPGAEAPVQEEAQTGITVQVGDPIDECDARAIVIIGIYLNRDAPTANGTRWCEEELTILNPSNMELVFSKHFIIQDYRNPADGPKWSVGTLSPGGFRTQLGYYHEDFYTGGKNYWYTDRMAVVYPSCFKDYDAWEIPPELIEPYAFDVPYYCSP